MMEILRSRRISYDCLYVAPCSLLRRRKHRGTAAGHSLEHVCGAPASVPGHVTLEEHRFHTHGGSCLPSSDCLPLSQKSSQDLATRGILIPPSKILNGFKCDTTDPALPGSSRWLLSLRQRGQQTNRTMSTSLDRQESLEVALLRCDGTDASVQSILRSCTAQLTLPVVKSVMAKLLDANATRHVLAVFDALPLLGIEADTATMNLALASVDVHNPGTEQSSTAHPCSSRQCLETDAAPSAAQTGTAPASTSVPANVPADPPLDRRSTGAGWLQRASAGPPTRAERKQAPHTASVASRRAGMPATHATPDRGEAPASADQVVKVQSGCVTLDAASGRPPADRATRPRDDADGAGLSHDNVAALMQACIIADDPAAVSALLHVLPRLIHQIDPHRAFAEAHACIVQRMQRLASSEAAGAGAGSTSPARASSDGDEFAVSHQEIIAACEQVAMALPHASIDAAAIQPALQVMVRVVAQSEDPLLAIRAAVVAQAASVPLPPDAQRSIVALCLATGNMRRLVEELVNGPVCTCSSLGAGSCTTPLLAACCLLPAAGMPTSRLGSATASPPSDPDSDLRSGDVGQSSNVARVTLPLSATTLRMLWPPQRMLDLIELLGSVGRWPEAAAVFWAALVVLAPSAADTPLATWATDSDACSSRASLKAMTDASRLTPLLSAFSLCRSVFTLRRQSLSRQERTDACNTLLKALLAHMRRAGARAGAASLMDAMLARHVSLDTSTSAMLLALGVHPREPTALAMLRHTAAPGRGRLELGDLSGAISDSTGRPDRPRESNVLRDTHSLTSGQISGSHARCGMQYAPSGSVSVASTLPTVPTATSALTSAALKSVEPEAAASEARWPPAAGASLVSMRRNGRGTSLPGELRAPTAAATGNCCELWRGEPALRPAPWSGPAAVLTAAAPLSLRGSAGPQGTPRSRAQQAAPVPSLCAMRVHRQAAVPVPSVATSMAVECDNGVEPVWPRQLWLRSASVPTFSTAVRQLPAVEAPALRPPGGVALPGAEAVPGGEALPGGEVCMDDSSLAALCGAADKAVLTIRPSAARQWLQHRRGVSHLPVFRGRNSSDFLDIPF
eukprot:jgi/Ulvmu1/9494/UM052_0064.1